VYRPDSYGPFAYYAYLPFAAIFPTAPAVIATLAPAACFDLLTLAGLLTLGSRLGGRPLALSFAFGYLIYPFPDLSLMAETNDARCCSARGAPNEIYRACIRQTRCLVAAGR
jgi:hypothetical protein